jgi:hypothetical protein
VVFWRFLSLVCNDSGVIRGVCVFLLWRYRVGFAILLAIGFVFTFGIGAVVWLDGLVLLAG